ncbi:hypothetical protein NDU88_001744 [Pleurodeles waltl]|uniref:Uncharacterized protein n=1 Tax=Pleurodeles waltl TaxID=8319 RepID=A0AAV7MLU7_PLEWA|nr:hypothetical protein NDU88_001744 [Pleurodeles waltl]
MGHVRHCGRSLQPHLGSTDHAADPPAHPTDPRHPPQGARCARGRTRVRQQGRPRGLRTRDAAADCGHSAVRDPYVQGGNWRVKVVRLKELHCLRSTSAKLGPTESWGPPGATTAAAGPLTAWGGVRSPIDVSADALGPDEEAS